MQNLPFLLLPFFLFISVVTNALGYYLCLFLYPLCIVLNRKIEIPSYVKQAGVILIAMYACFVISNFLNLIFPNPIVNISFYKEHFVFLKLLKSRLSTSYFTTGLFLLALFYVSHFNINYSKKSSKTKNLKFAIITPLESFFIGTFYASLFFSFCFFLEYILKIHYREIIYHFNFKPDPALLHQINRPTGLLANPLTLSSMSLGVFTFLYTYFCRCFFGEERNKNLPFVTNKKLLILYVLIPALSFLFILFLTLGRTAILMAFIALFLIPLFSVSRKNFFKILLFIGSLSIISYFICDSLGYVQRIESSIREWSQNGHMDNRAYFREIYIRMFLDKPWIGNGTYWIAQGVRDKYFVLLGYGNLNERNFPAHNTYLEILASGGIFCASLILYSLFKLGFMIKTYLMNRHLGNYTLWVAFGFSIIVNLFHAFTQNNFLEASTTYTYFYLLFVIFWQKTLCVHNHH